MRPLVYFLALLALVSCTDYVELGKKSGIYFLKDVEVEVDDVDDVEWEIGKKREVEISKGIRFKVGIPRLSENAAKTLQAKHGIDTWIYKVSKLGRSGKRHLGYVTFNTNSTSRITESFTLNVYYHAASVSQEFRRFHCPAFDHRLKLADVEVVDKDARARDEIYVRPSRYVRGHVTELSFAPLIFSGGAKLKGKYLVEIALYNSKENRTYSKFVPLNGYIEVKNEVGKRVKSCAGVKEELKPLPESRKPRIEDLQIR